MRLIDADDFIKRVQELYESQEWSIKDIHFSAKDIVLNMKTQPTIEVEPVRHGKWIKENIVLTSLPPQYRWHCSECGSTKVGYDESVLTPYCPNCGAKMELEEQL